MNERASIGSIMFRGAMWAIAAAMVGKLFTICTQLAIARLLVPSDVGLAAMAFSVAAVMSAFNSAGIRAILIQRQNEFATLAGQCFWLQLAFLSGAGLILLAIAPVAGIYFRQPSVRGLIAVIGLSMPLTGLSMVHSAEAYRNLLFRRINQIETGACCVQFVSTVVFAWIGLGPYSIVLSMPCVHIYSAVAYRMIAGRVHMEATASGTWTAILAPASHLMLFSFLNSMQTRGLNLAIGGVCTASVTGLFFWGFQVAIQLPLLLTERLRDQLFSGFARCTDEVRQRSLFLKVLRAILLTCGVLAVLQCVLAEPFIRMAGGAKWAESAIVIEYVSVGLLLLPAKTLSVSILLANGKNRCLATTAAIHTTVIFAAAAIGATTGSLRGIALGVGGAMLISNYIYVVRMCKEVGFEIRVVNGAIVQVLAPALLAAVVGVTVRHSISGLIGVLVSGVVVIIIMGTASLLFYGDLLRQIVPLLSGSPYLPEHENDFKQCPPFTSHTGVGGQEGEQSRALLDAVSQSRQGRGDSEARYR